MCKSGHRCYEIMSAEFEKTIRRRKRAMLHEFLTSNRDELIFRCRAKVAKRNAPQPTEKELEFGIPVFLTQLTNILTSENLYSQTESRGPDFGGKNDLTNDGMGDTASKHGGELLGIGLTVDQVVHDYGD